MAFKEMFGQNANANAETQSYFELWTVLVEQHVVQ